MYFIYIYVFAAKMWVAKATHIFFSKNINVFAIFQDRNFNVTFANNFGKFWMTGPSVFVIGGGAAGQIFGS